MQIYKKKTNKNTNPHKKNATQPHSNSRQAEKEPLLIFQEKYILSIQIKYLFL